MIYELRVYEPAPGRMQRLQQRFADVSLRLFQKHGMTAIGFWTPEIGEWTNRLVYLLAHQDLAARERAWTAFRADPEWISARDASEKDGPLVHAIHSQILNPTSFSPLK
jgi:hypothetical protein